MTRTETLEKYSEDKLTTPSSSQRNSVEPVYQDSLDVLANRLREEMKSTVGSAKTEIGNKVQEVEANTLKNVVTISSIFVAFFTFISGEFQLIQRFSFSQFLFFSPLFAGILLSFVLVLIAVIKVPYNKINFTDIIKILFIFLLPLVLSMFFSLIIYHMIIPQIENTEIDTTVLPNTTNTINGPIQKEP